MLASVRWPLYPTSSMINTPAGLHAISLVAGGDSPTDFLQAVDLNLSDALL